MKTRSLILVILILFASGPCVTSAYGDENTTAVTTGEKLDDRRYRTTIQFSGAVKVGAGNAAPTANWEPPVCWYEPTFTPAELRDLLDSSMWRHYVGTATDDPRWNVGDLH